MHTLIRPEPHRSVSLQTVYVDPLHQDHTTVAEQIIKAHAFADDLFNYLPAMTVHAILYQLLRRFRQMTEANEKDGVTAQLSCILTQLGVMIEAGHLT